MVKALDVKSNGIFPRRFEPCSQRIMHFSITVRYTCKFAIFFQKDTCADVVIVIVPTHHSGGGTICSTRFSQFWPIDIFIDELGVVSF